MSKWPLIPLGRLCTGAQRWQRSPNEEKISYIDISSVSQVTKQIVTPNIISANDAPSRAQQLIQAGDVLISNVRPNLNAVARATEKHEGHIASTGFTILRTTPNLDGSFLFHYTQSSNFIEAVLKTATGASYPATSSNKIRSIPIPLPPLDEQRRIADILDVAARLKETFERKLNSSRRCFEFELSACIEAAHSTKKFIKIASLTGGSTPTKGNPEYWTNGTIPWFSTKDLKSDILTDSVDHVTEKAIASTSLKKITNATVALSIRGMSLAHRVPMSIIPGGSTINQDLKVVDSDLPYSPNLWLAILTHKEQHLLSKVATSAHGTKRLEVSQILDLDIPIFEDAQLAKIEKLAKLRAETLMSFDQILDNATELYNSLATRAFAGEL